ncbi:hypothetical protein EST38_g4820 [Candolleomyces aberdarensis]|uniref:Uncharacterized protein n=1 Tax=Candolleomyces aberdarensis TaxID=2316362 RepID=A0A4Q2DM05_9AGAR|nr:hypothetical protein EST38_g4820 [Candolleomyces aberdarensis]
MLSSPTPAPVLNVSAMPRIGDPSFGVWAENLYTLEATDQQLLNHPNPAGLSVIGLSQPEKDFAATMSYFISQASGQNRVEAFLSNCYGYLFATWPFTARSTHHFPWYALEKKNAFRYELIHCSRTLPIYDPPYDWEVVLSLPYPSFQQLSEELKAHSGVLEDPSIGSGVDSETNDGAVSEASSDITLVNPLPLPRSSIMARGIQLPRTLSIRPIYSVDDFVVSDSSGNEDD